MLDGKRVRRYGYFDPEKVRRLLEKVRAGRTIGFKDNMAFVVMLSTQVWHHLFIEKFNDNFSTQNVRPTGPAEYRAVLRS